MFGMPSYLIQTRAGDGPSFEGAYEAARVAAQRTADEWGEEMFLSLSGVPYNQQEDPDRFCSCVDSKIAGLSQRGFSTQDWFTAALADRALGREARDWDKLTAQQQGELLALTVLEHRRRCIALLREL